ncbi:MAG TPA: hypothetical protein EYP04_08255 [Anaerolineae bacterium]|nr:hypothetical protein [Anaerolineae bacterium]
MDKLSADGGENPAAGAQHLAEVELELVEAVHTLTRLVRQLRAERCLLMVDQSWRYLLYRFLGGVASGVGSVLGATVVVGLFIYFLSHLLRGLEVIPILGQWIAQLVAIVEQNMPPQQ